MDALEQLEERAKTHPRRIVLAEGEDPRILEAAVRAVAAGIAHITLLGNVERITQELKARGAYPGAFTIIDPDHADTTPAYVGAYQEARQPRRISRKLAQTQVRHPLVLADLLVRLGEVDGSLAGAHYTTAETVRCALQLIGPRPGVKLISSFFLMLLDDPGHDLNGVYVLSDCGLVVDPDAGELAQIARDAADSFHALTDETPRIAMLSFSTSGSARHASVDKVIEATRRLREARPDLAVAGDIQLDAAVVPEIGQKKYAGYDFAAPANVLIFPNLHAGNIGYKLLERFARVLAVGPILQGLRRPANDLSRGCDAEAVYRAIVITVIQAHAAEQETEPEGG